MRYVWGPAEELAVVRRIFELYVEEARSQAGIARFLNYQRIPWRDGTPWNADRVQRILARELVVGFQAYGKSVVTLGARTMVRDRSRWRYVRVLDPIVDVDLFVAAQERMGALRGSQTRTDADLVRELRSLLLQGRPTLRRIRESGTMACATTYRTRFGSIAAAYERAGFQHTGYRRGINPNGTPLDRDQIIHALQALYGAHGRITLRLVKATPTMPSGSRIRQVFGSLRAAYAAAGLKPRRAGVKRAPAQGQRSGDAK